VALAKKILIIEDDPDIQSILGLALSREGHTIFKAGNGFEGLQALKTNPLPDLILLDLMMPVMNGYQVIEQLDQSEPRLRNLPLVILSAMPDGDKIARTSSRRFIAKPIDFDDLCDLISEL
jgi:two-component system chemotaxis response regulator CheY